MLPLFRWLRCLDFLVTNKINTPSLVYLSLILSADQALLSSTVDRRTLNKLIPWTLDHLLVFRTFTEAFCV